MRDTFVDVVALCFAVMGIVAILRPERVTGLWGVTGLTAAARNEVRAVYGGFGVSVAITLMAALSMPLLRAGICTAIGAALFGMAGGRVCSAVMDRTIGSFARAFFAIELVAGAALFWAR